MDVHMVTLVDLNVPQAKMRENTNGLLAVAQFVNDLNGARHGALVEVPEVAKKASKRGLADEESEVQEQCWALRQDCDCRWMVPWDVPPTASFHTNRRRFSCGRLVVSRDAIDENVFVMSSELGTAGRPLSDLTEPEPFNPAA